MFSQRGEKDPLEVAVRYVKGVGPKVADLLGAKGIRTAKDLLYHLPNRYLDRSRLIAIKDLVADTDQTAAGEIVAAGVGYSRGRRRIFEASLADETGILHLKWFRCNMRYFESVYQKGASLVVSGRVTQFRGDVQMVHPSVEILDASGVIDQKAPGIVPIYPAVPQIGQKYLGKIIHNALELCLPEIPDPLPHDFLERHRLCSLADALSYLHNPPSGANTIDLLNGRSYAHRRLVFEELFFLELGLALKRQEVVKEKGIVVNITPAFQKESREELPFTLTGAQDRVTQMICRDMAQPFPMNRLIQGDVGSGKTVVALLAARAAIYAGYQVAVMAPTEILAEQHFRRFRELLGPEANQIGLLTASLRDKEKKLLRLCLSEGRMPMVVGRMRY